MALSATLNKFRILKWLKWFLCKIQVAGVRTDAILSDRKQRSPLKRHLHLSASAGCPFHGFRDTFKVMHPFENGKTLSVDLRTGFQRKTAPPGAELLQSGACKKWKIPRSQPEVKKSSYLQVVGCDDGNVSCTNPGLDESPHVHGRQCRFAGIGFRSLIRFRRFQQVASGRINQQQGHACTIFPSIDKNDNVPLFNNFTECDEFHHKDMKSPRHWWSWYHVTIPRDWFFTSHVTCLNKL